MNSLKPLILLTILGGVGFGVYRSLHRGPAEPPPGVDTSVITAPEIKLGDPSALAGKDTGGKTGGPNLLQPAPGSTAPPFNASDAAGVAPEVAGPFSSATPQSSAADSAQPFNDEPGGNAAGASYAGPSVSPFTASAEPNIGDPPANAASGPASRNSTIESESFAAAWGTIQPKLAAGQLSDALKDLTAWYNHPSLTPSERDMLDKLLSELAGTVIYSQEHLLAAPYRVQPGERLADIAERHRVTPELLAKINALDPAGAALQPGQEIKVVPGPFSAIVDVATDRLTLMLDGRYAGSFSVADLGNMVRSRVQSGTPVEFAISQKTTAPIYNGPQGEIESGEPGNPLGQYLLALGGELAIHGTNPQASPQTDQPAGGIRLSAGDIVDVYDILTVGSRVIVRK